MTSALINIICQITGFFSINCTTCCKTGFRYYAPCMKGAALLTSGICSHFWSLKYTEMTYKSFWQLVHLIITHLFNNNWIFYVLNKCIRYDNTFDGAYNEQSSERIRRQCTVETWGYVFLLYKYCLKKQDAGLFPILYSGISLDLYCNKLNVMAQCRKH